MKTPSKRLRIRVSGRVQGVGYRSAVKHKADELGLTGWVRNEPDGSVILEAEGSNDNLEALIALCRLGPVLARVTGLIREEVPVEGGMGFEVRR